MREQIQNQSAGTIDAAFGQREARDASVQWQDFTGQLQRMAIVVGTRLLPQFMPFLSALASMMDRAGHGPMPTRVWPVALPRWQAVVAARIGFGALQFAFGSILGPVATCGAGLAQALGTLASMLPRLAGFPCGQGRSGSVLAVARIGGIAIAIGPPPGPQRKGQPHGRRWAVKSPFGGCLLQAGRAAMAMGWNFLRAG
jgi:hypothetical protein